MRASCPSLFIDRCADCWQILKSYCGISQSKNGVVLERGSVVAVTHESLSKLWGDSLQGQFCTVGRSQSMKINHTTIRIYPLNPCTLKVPLMCSVCYRCGKYLDGSADNPPFGIEF